MDEKEQPIKHWLLTGELGNLLQHLEQIKTLHDLIQSLLPEEFKASCKVENISKGCINLTVTNASVATLLRYEIPNLLAKLRENPACAGIASIKCHVIA